MMQVTAPLDSLFALATPQQPAPEAGAFAQLVAAKVAPSANPETLPAPALKAPGESAIDTTADPQAATNEFTDAVAMLFGAAVTPIETTSNSNPPVGGGEAAALELDPKVDASSPADALPSSDEALPTPASELAAGLDQATNDTPIDAPELPVQRPPTAPQDVKPLATRDVPAPPPTIAGETQQTAEPDVKANIEPLRPEPKNETPRTPTDVELALLATRSNAATAAVQQPGMAHRSTTRSNDLATPSIDSIAGEPAAAAGELSVDQPKLPEAAPAAARVESAQPQQAPNAPTAAAGLELQVEANVEGTDADGPVRFALPGMGEAIEPGTSTKPVASNSAFQAYLQSAPAHVTGLGMQIAHARQEGVERLQVKLSPEELGSVDITISVDDSKNTRVAIMVERAETLDLLARDARQLERVLQAQGIDLRGELHMGLREEQTGRDHARPDAGPSDHRNHDAIEPAADDIPAPVRLVADGLLDVVI